MNNLYILSTNNMATTSRQLYHLTCKNNNEANHVLYIYKK